MSSFPEHKNDVLLSLHVSVCVMAGSEKTVSLHRFENFITRVVWSVHVITTSRISSLLEHKEVLVGLLFLVFPLSYRMASFQGHALEHLLKVASVSKTLLNLYHIKCFVLYMEGGNSITFISCISQVHSSGHKHKRESLISCLLHSPHWGWSPQPGHRVLMTPLEPFNAQPPHLSGECHFHIIADPSEEDWVSPISPRGPISVDKRNRSRLSVQHCMALGEAYLFRRNSCLILAWIGACARACTGALLTLFTAWSVRGFASVLFTIVFLLLSILPLALFLKYSSNKVYNSVLLVTWDGMLREMPLHPKVTLPPPTLFSSMGYCILFVHGLSKLCTWLNRCGATTLTVSTVLLLLLFSWKTVKQNEIWLSRESLFRSGVQTLPHNAKVHYNYANFLKDQGRNREAIYHYRTALKLYPRHASALNNLGTLTRNTAEAKMYYQRALQLNPQHNRALFNLGNLLKSQEKKEEAVTLLKDSIRYGPGFADAYSSLASLLAEQERFKEAEEMYQAGIKNCPDNSDLHNNYGVFLVDTGSPEKAVAHYQQAIKLSPSHDVAMVNLGRLYRSLGDNSMAEEWYKRALKVARKAETLSPLGALFYNTGRYEEALQIYREAAALQPSHRELRLALAQVLAMMGQTKEAEKMTNHIVSEDTGCLECYRLLSAIYSKQEQHDKALGAIDKALQLKPKDPKVISELFFTKGNQLREQNLLDKAFESYKAAVELNPDQAQAWMNMGGIQHIKGNYVSARAYYERALLLVPDSKLLQENLAKLDRLEKRLQEVREKDQT
ncbi:hypothetical protein QTO34_017691 [Cnephaeus nilssonii]|uniref:Protein O-mannosyl-transferase TMTC1 n=1 Tax=Cnephaeus nilssonii TaxID=3371016 RepID=A0AA40I1H6_CNENI|nr:hypothetical protein QTO34_017691 [Eptesicus nilssonii]